MAKNDNDSPDDQQPEPTVLQIFWENYQLLWRIARDVGLSDSDADDVMQTVAIKIFTMRTVPDNPPAYLKRIVRNTAIDLLRKRRLPVVSDPIEPEDRAPTREEVCGRFMSAVFYHRLLRKAVPLLAESHREIIRLLWDCGGNRKEVIDELVRRAGKDPKSERARQNQRTRLSQAHGRLMMVSGLLQIRWGDSQYVNTLIDSLESGDLVHADVTYGLNKVPLPPESEIRLRTVVEMLIWLHEAFSTETDQAKRDREAVKTALSEFPRAYDLLEWKNEKSRVRLTPTVHEAFSTKEGLSLQDVRSLFRQSHQKLLNSRDWRTA